MSDDFDNLRPRDDDDDNDLPDWMSDESGEEGGRPSGDSLGFTGELSWRQDVERAFDEQLDEADDTLDWQKNQSAENRPTGSSFGFTGELDWKQLRQDDDSDESGASASPDWLTEEEDPFALPPQDEEPAASIMDEDDDPFALPPEPEGTGDEEDPFALPPQDEEPVLAEDDSGDPLAWLQQYSAEGAEGEPEADEPAAEVEIPSWLDDAEPEFADEAPLPDDAPPWLQEMDVPEQPMVEETGKLSADWLSGAENAPETTDNDMTFDQWQQLQDDLTRPRDIEEEMPDLFAELGGDVSPDDLRNSETGELPSWVLGMDELDTSDAPDWFTGDEGTQAPPETADEPDFEPESDDIFAELGLPAVETGYDFLDNPQPETPDWFDEDEEPAAVQDVPNWLEELGDLSDMVEASKLQTGLLSGTQSDELFDDLPDFELDMEAAEAPASPAAQIDPLDTSGLQDIDTLLASYEADAPLPSTGELLGGGADFDKLFSDEEVESIGSRRQSGRPSDISGLSPDAPEWLTELGASVEEVSAAAIVRKQTQREKPLDELSDRLQALHERGLELPASEEAETSEALKSLLPGVNVVLPSAPIRTSSTDRTDDLILTSAQQDKINLLRSLVGADDTRAGTAKTPSAIDLTLASPSLDDIAGLDEPDFGEAAKPAPAPRTVSRAARRRRLPKFDRLFIAVLLSVAVILPFVSAPARIGDLPPAQFALGSRQQAVFDRVDSVRAGQLVLVAAEYGATGAGELDTALDVLLRHILLRGARPVVVSGNAVGLLHARNILNEIAGDPAFLSALDRPQIQSGRDYYIARFLAASTIGLRAFSEDIPRLLSVDVNGSPTGIQADSLRDFQLIVIVAERADDVRGWAEQVAPLAGSSLVAATGQSAAPLSEPYVMPDSPERLGGLGGMLVGYRDAFTYRSMIESRLAGDIPPATEPPPTDTPIPAVEVTEEPGVEALTTEEVTATPEASLSPTGEQAEPTTTATRQPSATPSATFTQTPSSTPTNTPTPTATLTPAVTTAPGMVIRAVVDAAQAVNVREGPGRSFAPIGAASPGEVVQVIGRSGDGEWAQIRLEDGREGWMSIDLLAIEDPVTVTPGASPTAESARLPDGIALVSLISDVNVLPQLQDDATPEATADGTEESAELTPEATIEAVTSSLDATLTAPAIQSTNLYREERWYGMTLGLVAIIIIITLGMIVNILRGLFRRRGA